MKLSSFIEGLVILRGYYFGHDGYHTGTEHDQFYVYATDTPVSPENVAKLKELGWFQPNSDEYDPSAEWSAIV